MQRKLTDAKVKNAKPKDKAYKLADGGGLYLYVTKSGTKSFRYDFKLNEKWITLTFGQYPTLSLVDARKAHEEARSRLSKGLDPRTQNQDDNALKPFSYYAKAMMQTQDLRPATAKKKLLKMQAHLFPKLDKKTVEAITAIDLLNILKPVADKGNRYLARDLAGYCRQTFNYLLSLQLVENNPAATIAEILPKPKPATNFAHVTTQNDLGKIVRGVDQLEGDFAVKKALQLLPYLILRPHNMRFLKWSYVDLAAKLITIPADEMKMDREHKVPLSDQAVKLVTELKPLTGNKAFVFMSATGIAKNQAMSENTLNVALTRVIDEETGKPFGRGFITSHGFRHSCSTMLNELGYNADAIELQLAHASKDRIRATYNKAELLPERTVMMQEWADYLDGLKNKS
ncbi:Integrase [uncultured Thiomicrorhabdus sp.]